MSAGVGVLLNTREQRLDPFQCKAFNVGIGRTFLSAHEIYIEIDDWTSILRSCYESLSSVRQRSVECLYCFSYTQR